MRIAAPAAVICEIFRMTSSIFFLPQAATFIIRRGKIRHMFRLVAAAHSFILCVMLTVPANMSCFMDLNSTLFTRPSTEYHIIGSKMRIDNQAVISIACEHFLHPFNQTKAIRQSSVNAIVVAVVVPLLVQNIFGRDTGKFFSYYILTVIKLLPVHLALFIGSKKISEVIHSCTNDTQNEKQFTV